MEVLQAALHRCPIRAFCEIELPAHLAAKQPIPRSGLVQGFLQQPETGVMNNIHRQPYRRSEFRWRHDAAPAQDLILGSKMQRIILTRGISFLECLDNT